jgi:hypothetical protein
MVNRVRNDDTRVVRRHILGAEELPKVAIRHLRNEIPRSILVGNVGL